MRSAALSRLAFPAVPALPALLLCAACGAGAQATVAAGPSTAPSAASLPPAPLEAPPLVAGQPLVELKTPGKAVVNGQEIAFDGVEEGLVWPALDQAVPDESYPGAVVLRVARGEPMKDVLRAVFTLREADLLLEGDDAVGTARYVTLRAKKRHQHDHHDAAQHGGADQADQAGAEPRCHLAVFRRDDGSLRVAAPGGPRELAAPGATARLVDALQATRAECRIRYVAFGTLDTALSFGPLFDVILAVDGPKAAGDARYVLAEPVEPPK